VTREGLNVTPQEQQILNNHSLAARGVALILWENLFPNESLSLSGLTHLMIIATSAEWLQRQVRDGFFKDNGTRR